MQYPYEIGDASDIAKLILSAVTGARQSGAEGDYVTFENCMARAGIRLADGNDTRACSRAMQVLSRRGVCCYSRSRKAWLFYQPIGRRKTKAGR